MNLLHVYADWRWNGPAQSILYLCEGMARYGHTVFLLLPRPPPHPGKSVSFAGRIQQKSESRRLFLLEDVALYRPFYCSNPRNWRGLRALRSWIQKNRIDVVHVHTPKDQALVLSALRPWLKRRGGDTRTIRLFRFDHTGLPRISHGVRSLSYFFRGSRQSFDGVDAWIHFSRQAFEVDRNRSGDVQTEKTFWIPPVANAPPATALSLTGTSDIPKENEFANGESPSPQPSPQEGEGVHRKPNAFGYKKRALRADFGLMEGECAGGIIARVQKHRRFDILIGALRRLKLLLPAFKFFIIGRGTRREELVDRPIRKMGLTENVLLPGYLTDTYWDVLSMLDFGVFLKPGSDGTCRTVREWMMAAKPVIVSDYGMLPELIQGGETGWVVPWGDEKALANALYEAYAHRKKVLEMGRRAKTYALTHFSMDRQGEGLEKIYSTTRL